MYSIRCTPVSGQIQQHFLATDEAAGRRIRRPTTTVFKQLRPATRPRLGRGPPTRRPRSPVGESFGFASLITVFLPGLALSIGIILFFKGNETWLREYFKPLLELFRDSKNGRNGNRFLQLSPSSPCLGQLSAVNGLMEAWIYDQITPCCMRISRAEFNLLSRVAFGLVRSRRGMGSWLGRNLVWGFDRVEKCSAMRGSTGGASGTWRCENRPWQLRNAREGRSRRQTEVPVCLCFAFFYFFTSQRYQSIYGFALNPPSSLSIETFARASVA